MAPTLQETIEPLIDTPAERAANCSSCRFPAGGDGGNMILLGGKTKKRRTHFFVCPSYFFVFPSRRTDIPQRFGNEIYISSTLDILSCLMASCLLCDER